MWQAADMLVLVLGTFLVGNLLIAPERAVTGDMLGHDFLAFYTGGTMARVGEFQQMYDLDATRQFQQALARAEGVSLQGTFGPFWNPPLYAWLFAPLSAMRYRDALGIWIGINLLAVVGSVVLMVRMLPLGARQDWRTWALVPLLLCTSMPFIQVLTHAQNTCISLLLLCCIVTAWRAQRDLMAGVLCAMLFYKPQLAAVIAVVLIFNRGWRAAIGLSITLGLFVLVTAATMPGAIGQYLHQLPLNLHFMQVENPYLWDRHVTFKAMWRLMFQGTASGEAAVIVQVLTLVSCAAVGLGLLVSALRSGRTAEDDIFTGETRFIRRDRLIAATIASMPLLMPFYFDYDLLLLGVPAVLLAGEVMMRPPGTSLARRDGLLIGGWAVLYAWSMINPVMAIHLGLNVTVLLLAMVAGLLIERAARQVQPGPIAPPSAALRVTARRAA
jgi:hypothetical protein